MFLNLKTKDIERHIYRITTLDRVKELFESGQNVLVQPSAWDDPYENYILRSKVRLKSGDIVEYNFHEKVYGQCWSLHSTSDAMWRIYAPDRRGVRIRTTVRRLAETLAEAHRLHTQARCRVGRVQYLSQNAADALARRTFDDYGIGVDNLFASLLAKRKAFTHEREVRALYFELRKEAVGNKLYSYAVDPHALVSQIMLDPRLSKDEAEYIKEDIRDSTGFKGPILRSLLYSPPKERIIDVSDWAP